MKLELKHLAGYLPYELDCIWQKENYTLRSVTIANRCQLLDKFDDVVYGTKIEHVKPILRPLSDFTKEIEVNGKKFVPDAKMKELGLGLPRSLDCNWMYYQQHQKLLEWHFDLFELIPVGLAIDINSVFEVEKNENI